GEAAARGCVRVAGIEREVGRSKRSGIPLDGGNFERHLASRFGLPVRSILGLDEWLAQDQCHPDQHDQTLVSHDRLDSVIRLPTPKQALTPSPYPWSAVPQSSFPASHR